MINFVFGKNTYSFIAFHNTHTHTETHASSFVLFTLHYSPRIEPLVVNQLPQRVAQDWGQTTCSQHSLFLRVIRSPIRIIKMQLGQRWTRCAPVKSRSETVTRLFFFGSRIQPSLRLVATPAGRSSITSSAS